MGLSSQRTAETRGRRAELGAPFSSSGAPVGPPLELWVVGESAGSAHVPGCSHVVTAVEQLPVLWSQLGASQNVETTPHEVSQQREFNPGHR